VYSNLQLKEGRNYEIIIPQGAIVNIADGHSFTFNNEFVMQIWLEGTPPPLALNAYYRPNSTLGARINNTELKMGLLNIPVDVFKHTNGATLTVSTDKRNIYEIWVEKWSDNVNPYITHSMIDSWANSYYRTMIFYWFNDSGSNYNTVEINLSDLNLSNGTYYVSCWDQRVNNGEGLTGYDYMFIVNDNHVTSHITPRFSDVHPRHWAYESIMLLAERGVITGYEDGTFRPNGLVTRSEFAVMMTLALEIPLLTRPAPTFADVGRYDWDFIFVETAKPYLTGYQQGSSYYFRGNEAAVREDMAVALVNAMGLSWQAVNENELKSIFSDWADISPNLRKHVLIAYKNGLISGYTDGTFGAQRSITRAETASLLVKVLSSEAMEKVTFN
jgi:hypothetical protein